MQARRNLRVKSIVLIVNIVIFFKIFATTFAGKYFLIYEAVSIISRTCAAIWSKANFGPTGHHP
jgi:hypothetical protein